MFEEYMTGAEDKKEETSRITAKEKREYNHWCDFVRGRLVLLILIGWMVIFLIFYNFQEAQKAIFKLTSEALNEEIYQDLKYALLDWSELAGAMLSSINPSPEGFELLLNQDSSLDSFIAFQPLLFSNVRGVALADSNGHFVAAFNCDPAPLIQETDYEMKSVPYIRIWKGINSTSAVETSVELNSNSSRLIGVNATVLDSGYDVVNQPWWEHADSIADSQSTACMLNFNFDTPISNLNYLSSGSPIQTGTLDCIRSVDLSAINGLGAMGVIVVSLSLHDLSYRIRRTSNDIPPDATPDDFEHVIFVDNHWNFFAGASRLYNTALEMGILIEGLDSMNTPNKELNLFHNWIVENSADADGTWNANYKDYLKLGYTLKYHNDDIDIGLTDNDVFFFVATDLVLLGSFRIGVVILRSSEEFYRSEGQAKFFSFLMGIFILLPSAALM